MLFSSVSFLYYFLPTILILYFLVKEKYRNLVLLLASLFFYFYGEPIYTFLMIFSAVSGYIHGRMIHKTRNTIYAKIFLISSITISLGMLGLFKYSNFVISNINYIFNNNFSLLKITLPIGISFYTFQILSYVIDVYENKVKVCNSVIDFATYVCLFPQLIAGPIVRYATIQKELNYRVHSYDKVSYGISRFIIGLSKKVIIANNLGLLVDMLNSTYEKSILLYWISAIAFMIQIYYDFSGYSDMAIGLGRIFGFTFLENFNYPFISKSISEFWRRWHISLSSFFRDYVYIPLGGNKVSKFRWIVNIVIVWFLTGLWHGASWNFVLWGLYFALLLIAEKLFLNKVLTRLPLIIQHIYTIFFIIISFVIFSGNNMTEVIVSISSMFSIGNLPFSNEVTLYYLNSYFILLIISIIGCTPLVKITINKIKENNIGLKLLNICEIIMNILLLLIVTSYLIEGSFNPFLYFRF